jgi:DNA polymerase-1
MTTNRIVANKENLGEINSLLKGFSAYSLDTETYGLKYEDKAFSAQITNGQTSVYFNFKDYEDGTPIVSYQDFVDTISCVDGGGVIWYIQNAKFDMRRLDMMGYELRGNIWDTWPMERLIRNNYLGYSLDDHLKRRNKAKNDTVAEYIKENGLVTSVVVDGRKTKEKIKHYDQVPPYLIIPYGLDDVEDCFFVAEDQRKYLRELNDPKINELVITEMKLIKTVYEMEKTGIKIHRPYCEEGKIYEHGETLKCIADIEKMSGKKFKTGPIWLKGVLDDNNIPYKVDEETGNPILDKYALQNMGTPLTDKILEMRDHEKKGGAFYSSILHLADSCDIIHPNFMVGGTDTGRFSCSNPNIQQMPKEDKPSDLENKGIFVRGVFVPRPNHIFVMMDYDQMEYRMLADYAGETDLIRKILDGLDPHTAVAQMLGIDRKSAKTINFGLLYGLGKDKLAKSLKIPAQEAVNLKNLYFSRLTRIQRLMYKIQDTAKGRGYVINKYGRRYYLDDPKFAYRMLNHLIQGSSADVVRHAMVKIHDYLENSGLKSKMLIQVHDELLFEIHEDELHIIPMLRGIMEDEYKPHNMMTLSCGVEWSPYSWASKDRIDGIPTIGDIHERRNKITIAS